MNLSALFERRYLASLQAYRFFYDDIHEYGSSDSPSAVFYFIPGLNGVPGQIRFALPGIQRVLGGRIYVQCLHLPEFSASVPVWEKYTEAHLALRETVLVNDLEKLAARHQRILVVASSTAFYEFAAAFALLSPRARGAITLLWAAVAPDQFAPSIWERVFFPLTGLERGGHGWTAVPNHNALSFLNPETCTTHHWRSPTGSQRLYKCNLESRFRVLGLSWGYFSSTCTNWVFQRSIQRIPGPLDVRAIVLAAERDGYWQGRDRTAMEAVIQKYIVQPELLWKPASHLWVTVPENIHRLVARAVGQD